MPVPRHWHARVTPAARALAQRSMVSSSGESFNLKQAISTSESEPLPVCHVVPSSFAAEQLTEYDFELTKYCHRLV